VKNAALKLLLAMLPLAILLLAPVGCEAAPATYAGIYEEPITLSDGRYEGEPFVPDGASRPTVGLLDELQLVADLDGDGAGERIVLLWESSGGSGTSLYIARVRPDADTVATYVGDRVEIRSMAQVDGLLQMGVLRAGADDAMCCPGELADIRWRATVAGLDFVSDEIEGRFGLSTVAGEWRLDNRQEVERLLAAARAEGSIGEDNLRVFVTGETAIAFAAAEAEITLTISTDGTVTGRSGCNQYSGAVRFSAPNAIDFGPLRMTLMACEQSLMAAEQEFLSRVQTATQAGFHMGKLALSWQTEDTRGTLLFLPR